MGWSRYVSPYVYDDATGSNDVRVCPPSAMNLQGAMSACLCLIGFKREQGPAELQLVRSYINHKEQIRKESKLLGTRLPCVVLEVTGHELRCAPCLFSLLDSTPL